MRDETCNVRAARREDANEEGQTKIFAPGPTSSHLALADRSPRSLLPQTLFLLPLFPPARWLWDLLPQPRVSSSTPPRAFRPEARPTASPVETSTPYLVGA